MRSRTPAPSQSEGDVDCTLGNVLTLTPALTTTLAPLNAALDLLEACLTP